MDALPVSYRGAVTPESMEARWPADRSEDGSGPADSSADELGELRRLRRIVDRSGRPERLTERDVVDLPRLYRHACSVAARLEAAESHPRTVARVRQLVTRAHGLLFDARGEEKQDPWATLRQLLLVEAPRAVRSEWRLLALSFGLVYGLALVAWFAVSGDLDLAASLLSPAMVESEIAQLRATENGESFRGNFTFGWGESPAAAGMVTLNNIGVGILFFASALIPPLYLYILARNALMLGTYTAVAGHWGQAGAISSILWCHGTLEIQAIVLAGTAGLCLVRAWIRPGPFTRRHALQHESRHALLLLAPTVPILIVAGLIEGFVSPHAPFAVRVAVGAVSGALLVAWALLGGRAPTAGSATVP